jgi:hypothetical protein
MMSSSTALRLGGGGSVRPGKIRAFSTVLVITLLSACSNLPQETPEPAPIGTPDPAKVPSTVQPTPKPIPCHCPEPEIPSEIIGEVEYALVGNRSLLQKARIDTGATTTSVGIADMKPFERDGNKWLRFNIHDRLEGDMHEFERPLLRMVDIKRHGAEAARRPVVSMNITIGDVSRDIEVTLADRDAFEYPVLIGRNFLDSNVLVDVSKRYIATAIPE